MDVDMALKSALSSLGVKVFAPIRPANSAMPSLTYKRISEVDTVVHNGGRASPTRSRFQITHVADSYSGMMSLVESVKAKLIGNTTDFNAAIASDTHIDDKDAQFDIYLATKDYFIWY